MGIALAPDFSDFLRLLNAHAVDYLLIGGYAVAVHGYARATQDLDVWVAVDEANAARIAAALREFGFASATPELFLAEERIVRMGVPPMRIELLTGINGVVFAECMRRAERVMIADLDVPVIALDDLKKNKRAAGRPKDLDDLENLP